MNTSVSVFYDEDTKKEAIEVNCIPSGYSGVAVSISNKYQAGDVVFYAPPEIMKHLAQKILEGLNKVEKTRRILRAMEEEGVNEDEHGDSSEVRGLTQGEERPGSETEGN
jgi:hypothetical protein